MSRIDKVVWSEGMFLTPQLFQQADRYHEGALQFAVRAGSPFAWGLTGLQIDAERLTNGDFSVVRATGIMPDGLAIRIPDHDAVPESRSIRPHFTTAADSADVYLAIPVSRPQTANVEIPGNGATPRPVRYRAEVVRAVDETADGAESEISVARKNFKVLFSDESLDDVVRMKIAEVRRTRTGTFELDESYIAPALSSASSPALMAIVRRLLEILSAKSSVLSGQRRHLADFGASDMANFWLLHTVNSSIPAVAHAFDTPERHPEALYLDLVRLTAELSTFALDADARQLPRYDHLDLRATFGDLERRIPQLLETIIPTRYQIIPLELTPESIYVGRISDERLLKARFYLGVQARMPVNKLTEEVPAKAKITSRERINSLIGRALPGVELSYEPVPPTAIPVRAGHKYFQLGTSGTWWDAVTGSRGIAIFLPQEFPELALELVAVKD